MNGRGPGGGMFGLLARVAAALVLAGIGLQLVAAVLPRLLGPLTVLTCLVVVVRIVWHMTTRY